MSAALISLLLTLGAATWLYTKFQKYNGNNLKSSAIATAISALIMFLVFYSVLKMVIK